MWRSCVFVLLSSCVVVPYTGAVDPYERSLLTSAFSTNPSATNITHLMIIDGEPIDIIQTISSKPTEQLVRTVSFKNTAAMVCSMDANYARRQLYLYEMGTRSIILFSYFDWSNVFANLTSSTFQRGLSKSSNINIAVDWVSNNVYWTDPLHRWIALRSGAQGSEIIDQDQYKVIVRVDLEIPVALAVDPVHGYMFWSDIGRVVKIERANLIGGERIAIISTGLAYPTAIDVDLTSSHIYWVDAKRDSVESADFNGNNRRTVRRMAHTEFTDLVVLRDTITVNDYRSGKVYFINATTGENLYEGGIGTTSEAKRWALALYTPDVQPPMTDRCGSCSDLCVNQQGTPQCLCREGYRLNTDGVTCTEVEGAYHKAIVMAGSGAVCMIGIRVLNAEIEHTECFLNVSNIAHFDIDMISRKFYYAKGSDVYSHVISTSQPSLNPIFSSLTEITGLSLNWLDGNIYVTTGRDTAGAIMVHSQASSTLYTILNTDLHHPRDLVVLPLDGLMVWFSGSAGSMKIEKSALDGTERQTIVNSDHLSDANKITVDTNSNMLYWTGDGVIKRSRLDGTEIETLSINNIFHPNLITIYQNNLIFTENVFSTSYIKLDVVTSPSRVDREIESPIGALTDMKIIDSFLQPSEKGPCDVMNGGCEHICLPIGRTKLCQCEYGFQLDSNKETCSSTLILDNFLLVTDWTHDRIYQVALDSDAVFGLDTDQISNPIGVAFNSITHHVIWGDNAGLVHRIHLNGSGYEIFADLAYLEIHTDRFAIDYSTGNLFYTAVSVSSTAMSGVGVLNPDGLNRKLIENGQRPRDIVLDPEDGLLFWSDHGVAPFVKSARMDGTELNTILSGSSIVWPNGLAIDTHTNYLYLSDGSLNTIRRCNYGGTCQVFYESKNSHMMDIVLLDRRLYFTAWNRQFIIVLDIDDTSLTTKLAQKSELGRLDSLAIYRSIHTPYTVSEACSQNNGDCSTFCFATPNRGHVCGCEDGVDLKKDDRTCENIIPTTTTTTTTTTTSTSSTPSASVSTMSTGAQPFVTEKSTGGIPIPTVAGAVAGALFLIFLVIIIIIVVVVKRKPKTHLPFTNDAFDDPYLHTISGEAAGGERPGSDVYDHIDDLHREDGVYKTEDKLEKSNNMYRVDLPPVNKRVRGTDTLSAIRNVPSALNDYQTYVPRDSGNHYMEPMSNPHNTENQYFDPIVDDPITNPDSQYLDPVTLTRQNDLLSSIGNHMYSAENGEANVEDQLTPRPTRRQPYEPAQDYSDGMSAAHDSYHDS